MASQLEEHQIIVAELRFGRRNQIAFAPRGAILKQSCLRLNGNWSGLTMHDQRDLTQDVVLRARVAMANRLIAEQSATIARAHSAIERAMETLRGPDGSREAGKEQLSC